MTRGFLKTLRFFHLINKKAYKIKKRMKKYAPEYRAIAKSPLFDAKWYLEHNPDVAAAKADPVEHYLTIGWKEDRPTTPYFDGKAYLQMYPDVAEADRNPLAHWLLHGQFEDRYADIHLQEKRLAPFLSVKTAIRNIVTYPKSTLNVMGKHNVDKNNKHIDGYLELKNSSLFDCKFYKKNNAEIKECNIDPIEHYLMYGWKNNRNPSKKFNNAAYLNMYGDVKKAGVCPLLHYIRHGKKEGRKIDYNKFSSMQKKIIKFFKKKNNSFKRILCISHEMTYTGAPISLLQSAECLQKMGYKVRIMTLKEGPLSKEFEKKGMKVRLIDRNMWSLLRGMLCSDVVIVNTIIPYYEVEQISALMPTIWLIRESSNYVDNNRDLKRVLKNQKSIYTMSEYSASEYKSYNCNINILHHGIPDSYRHAKLNKDIVRFAVIGTIEERKGQDIVVNACSKIKERMECYIIGKVCDKKLYEKIKNISNSVIFVPEIKDKTEMKNFYEKISCVVVPSREEPTSRVALEAFMMGRPVIMSDHVGAQYALTEGENGYLFKSEDVDDLAKCMNKIINDYKVKSFEEQCRKHYIKFNSMERFSENLNKMIAFEENKVKSSIKIVIHVHLFYGEQVHYFINNLKNICCDFDLYVTCVHVTDYVVSELKKFDKNVHIIKVKNIGYDVYPFWIVLQLIDLNDYDFILKLHTKNQRNSPWIKEGIRYTGFDWRNDLVEPLIGSKKLFKNALNILRKSENGMVCSKNLIHIIEHPSQIENTKKICSAMGYKYAKYQFCCGTMFMMKSFLLDDFKKYKFNENDFTSNSSTGSTGTLAHSIETLFGIIVANYGLKVAGVHNIKTLTKSVRRDVSRFIKKIFSKKRKFYENDLEYIKRSKLFNKKWYKKYYKLSSDISPEEHYLHVGWKKGFNPSPDFKTEDYLLLNQDVKRANMNPLLHYEKHGKYENRQATIYNMVNDKSILNKISNCSLYGITRKKRNQKVIVSLTTYPARINEVAVTIYSLLKQSLKPDEIVLWLGADKFKNREKDLPENLLKLKNNGLTIKWCKDMRSFTKLVPALEMYKNDIIVTADDDIYYNKDWLKKLYECHVKYPRDIICHRVHEVTICDNKIAPYNCWKWASNDASSSYFNFLTGVGGVLYPANSLYKDVLKRSVFEKLCPYADDVWFWAMAILNKTKIRNIKNGYNKLMYTNLSREKGLIAGDCLYQKNIGNNYNDVQIENVINKYKNIRRILKLT